MTTLWNPAPPHSWWTVDVAAVGMTGGIALYYRLGPRRPIRDDHGRWLRDAAGRTALEAFGALPLGEMYRRLREGDEAWRASGDEATRAATVAADPEREPRRWLTALAELVEFVKRFGPLGFAWSRTYPVENRDADRALDELDRKRMADAIRAIGGTPSNDPIMGRRREWQVIFPRPGFSGPNVHQVHSFPEEPWTDRVRFGDAALRHDFLGPEPTGPLWGQQDDLRRVLKLVKALAKPDPNPFDIRDAAGGLPGFGEYDVRDYGVRDPVDVRWSDAMRPKRDLGGRRWSPFEEHPARVDWATIGRLMLAEYLSAQLAWTTIEAGLDQLGRIRTRWTPHSLLEVIYLQLLEHVEERLEFGVGDCLRCGGPVLRTRRSEKTQNRAHHGCAALLRKRRQRERGRERQAAALEEPS